MGWDPREPGFLALGLLLVVASGIVPWWGFVADTSEIPYTIFEGTDLGPWFTEVWQFQILPGTALRDGHTRPWWDFVRIHPEYGGYGTAALVACSLWAFSLASCVATLGARYKPGSRHRGRPTILAGIGAAVLGVAIVVAGIGFSAGAGLSFAGSADRLTWGPKVGWFLALGAVGLLSTSTVLGWAADRSVKGLCWKCYRKASGGLCDYCGAAQ